MYHGEHGLTVIELPDGRTIYSRDVHVLVSLQSVVEIVSLGKFFVHSFHGSFSRSEVVPDKDRIEGVSFQAPYSLHRLKVGAGDFAGVETDFRYLPGTDIRPDEEAVQPVMRLELGPPEWMQTPLREAAALQAEAEAVAAGRLHAAAYEQAVAATVFVVCEYGDGIQKILPSGTGFLINPHGFIVTNGHVVAPTMTIPKMPRQFVRLNVRVTLFSGQDGEKSVPATVVQYSKTPDLALLKIDGDGHDFLCLDGDDLAIMAPVLALGYPGGQMLALSGGQPQMSFRAGQITALRSEPKTRSTFVEHSAPMEQGNSGGPLVTPRGTVVGVNTLLHGPQRQTRLALSRDTLRGYLFQETAEGKGPYFGPDADERYTIFMAREAVAWSYVDANISHFTSDGLFTWPGWDTTRTPDPKRVLIIGTEALTALGHLLAALDHLNPPGVHYLSHTKVREGLRLQSETLAKMIHLMAPEAEDRLAEANRHLSGNKGHYDRHDEFGRGINEIQAGRTQLNFAFNRVIGQYWNMIEEVKQPPPPFHTIVQPSEYKPEMERHVMAELGNIFQRHRGKRVAIIHFRMTDEGGSWERIIVYRHGLVSGSDALYREIARLIESQDWETKTERLTTPRSAPPPVSSQA